MSLNKVPFSKSNSIDFRLHHLDALRAFAVTYVVFFHLKIPGFSAGYLGVDLFFILSGFLMTWTMLVDHQKHDEFRLFEFFKRRFRRIVPSLILTILFSLFLSYLLMSPQHLLDTAKQSIPSLFFYSNIYFYDQAGYFEPSNEVRLLLHTWSLSVEEQYYIIFGLIIFLGKYYRLLYVLALLFFISIAIMVFAYFSLYIPNTPFYLTGDSEKISESIFYLIPYRIYQFSAGAIFAKIAYRGVFFTSRAMSVLSITVASCTLMLLTQAEYLHQWASILATLCFLPLLLAPRIPNILAKTALVQFVSRISYQVYLVHWPIIVLWRYWTFEDLNFVGVTACGALSLVLGWLLSQVVAQNSSQNRKLGNLFKVVMLPFICVIVMSIFVISTKGASFRIPDSRQMPTSDNLRLQESAFCNGTNMLGDKELGISTDSPLITCTRSGDDQQIFIWGDSHARSLLPGFAEAYKDATINVLYLTGCQPQSGIGHYVYEYPLKKALSDACVERNRAALELFEAMAPTTIILHMKAGYEAESSKSFTEASVLLLDKLRRAGHSVFWIGSVPYPDRLLADCMAVPAIYSDAYLVQRCRGSFDAFSRVRDVVSDNASRFADSYIDVTKVFCPSGTFESCSMIAHGMPLFRDKHHLSIIGSVTLVKSLSGNIRLLPDL